MVETCCVGQTVIACQDLPKNSPLKSLISVTPHLAAELIFPARRDAHTT